MTGDFRPGDTVRVADGRILRDVGVHDKPPTAVTERTEATMTEPIATHAGPATTVTLIPAGDGTWIHPDDIAAQYIATDQCWVDMPEARPRSRARVTNGQPDASIVITKDGELHYSPDAHVKIDRYQEAKYAAVRAEGEARRP